MGVAGLASILHDGQDARRALAVLPLQPPAHVLGVGREALCRWHDAVEVRGQGFGAGCPGAGAATAAPTSTARAGQRLPRWHLRRPVLVTVRSRGNLGGPAAVVGRFSGPRWDRRSRRDLRLVQIRAVAVVTGQMEGCGLVEGAGGPRVRAAQLTDSAVLWLLLMMMMMVMLLLLLFR